MLNLEMNSSVQNVKMIVLIYNFVWSFKCTMPFHVYGVVLWSSLYGYLSALWSGCMEMYPPRLMCDSYRAFCHIEISFCIDILLYPNIIPVHDAFFQDFPCCLKDHIVDSLCICCVNLLYWYIWNQANMVSLYITVGICDLIWYMHIELGSGNYNFTQWNKFAIYLLIR
jgi:hypothetical protein